MMDRPILFSGPMVRALIEGRKTRTRRILKPQPPACDHMLPVNDGTDREFTPRGWEGEGPIVIKGGEAFCGTCGAGVRPDGKAIPIRYAIGDRLWVREAWRADVAYDDMPPRLLSPQVALWFDAHPGHIAAIGNGVAGRLRPGIHMPRWASRLTLTVTGVRIERLQDITEEEAWAEGCAKGHPDDVGGFFPAEEPDPSGVGWRGWDCARDWFADLWEEINGEEAWDANPWVTVTSFTVERRNIDMPRAA